MSEFTGLACEYPKRLVGKVVLSEVTLTDDATLYEPGAIVPDPSTLRHASPDEIEPFLATPQTPPNGRIEIVTRLQGFARAVAGLQRMQSTYCDTNQLTTTQNEDSGLLRPGLHLDSYNQTLLVPGNPGIRRTALNHGPGTRYLLFGSMDIFDLAEQLGKTEGEELNTGDVRAFVRANPGKLQCLWLPLPPQSVYFAPTDAIVHEGSTWNQDKSVISFWDGEPDAAIWGHTWRSAI